MLGKELPLHARNRGACSACEKNCLTRGKETHLHSERAIVVPHVGGGIQSGNRATSL